MLPDYPDIYAVAGDTKPVWHDNNGVPRFAPFSPDLLGVYDVYALLVQISCQSCARMFHVGVGWSRYEALVQEEEFRSLGLPELADGFCFGDPPAHACGGDTMSSVSVRIVEAWERVSRPRVFPEWRRVSEVEQMQIMQSWAADEGR